jgi:hypothetical protein
MGNPNLGPSAAEKFLEMKKFKKEEVMLKLDLINLCHNNCLSRNGLEAASGQVCAGKPISGSFQDEKLETI